MPCILREKEKHTLLSVSSRNYIQVGITASVAVLHSDHVIIGSNTCCNKGTGSVQWEKRVKRGLIKLDNVLIA